MITILVVSMGLPVSTVRADLFDTARQAVRTDLSRADSTGVTVRGGAAIAPNIPPRSATLLRGQANLGGACGSFNFLGSIQDAFESIPGLFESLLDAVIANLPMLALCYASPTLCDLAKHWQSIINAVIQAKFAQCQQVQTTMAYAGLRMRGGAISQCLEDEAEAGTTLSRALDKCNGGASAIRSPFGDNRSRINLIDDTLTAAGTNQEMRTLATTLLGEITLQANGGPLSSRHDRASTAMLARYETHRQAAEAALRRGVSERQATGDVSAATLQAASVPGQPLPRAAIDALAVLQNDTTRSESYLAKLSTGVAITQLTWECHELQEALDEATEANSHVTDEQRRLLQLRLASLQRDLKHVMEKKEAAEKHLQPAVEALLADYTRVLNHAADTGLSAPSVQPPRARYGTQSPSGYGH
jgi:hypothetical protein